MATSAERMRALRERERRGLRRLTIGAGEDDLRTLAERGFLLDDAEDTGRRLASALSVDTGARRIQPAASRDLLAAKRNDRHDRLAGKARRDRGYQPFAPSACGARYVEQAAIIRPRLATTRAASGMLFPSLGFTKWKGTYRLP
jgi:hypothetical protein